MYAPAKFQHNSSKTVGHKITNICILYTYGQDRHMDEQREADSSIPHKLLYNGSINTANHHQPMQALQFPYNSYFQWKFGLVKAHTYGQTDGTHIT